MKVKIIVDASQFVHANFHIWKNAHNAATLADAIVANIQSAVFKISQEVTVDSVVLALDSRPTFRHQIFPGYKSRPPNSIDWDGIEAKLQENFTCLKCDLLEADDIIYIYALLKHKKDDAAVIILGSDRDHFQTVDRVGCLQYCTTVGLLPTSKESVTSWKCKLILGCKSDDVPSIAPARTGEKTIQKMLDKGMTVKEIMLHYKIDPAGTDAQSNADLIYYDMLVYGKYVSYENQSALITKINSL